jgi:hypothetical protein
MRIRNLSRYSLWNSQRRERGKTAFILSACALGILLSVMPVAPVLSDHGTPGCEGIGPFGVPGLDLPPNQIGDWGSVITFPVQATHAVVLSTGKVLFWRDAIPAYVFDPATETYSSVGQPDDITPNGDLFCAGHATMADGRIMIIGGSQDHVNETGNSGSYIFDPFTETWATLPDMAHSRWYPTLTTLLDGRMLATGGTSQPGVKVYEPEIYDPKTNVWIDLPNADNWDAPVYPQMYAITSGEALNGGPRIIHTLDVESSSSAWTSLGSVSGVSGRAETTAAMYLPDRVIRIGGAVVPGEPINQVRLLDMTQQNPGYVVASPMYYPRRRADAVLLPDGTVMVSGGAIASQEDSDCAVHAPEIWDPDTQIFTTVASQALPRMYHSTSVLMPDGRVLTGGGEGGGGPTAEIYSPAYLFKGPRPTVTSAPQAADYSSAFQVVTPDALDIVSVAALRPAAITHNFDQNQRYLPLEFVADSDSITITAPPAEETPPGDYMLFLLNSNGVPSVAEFVRFGQAPGDINDDGLVDISDLLLMQRALTGQITLNAGQMLRADVSPAGGNGVLDMADLIALKSILVTP